MRYTMISAVGSTDFYGEQLDQLLAHKFHLYEGTEEHSPAASTYIERYESAFRNKDYARMTIHVVTYEYETGAVVAQRVIKHAHPVLTRRELNKKFIKDQKPGYSGYVSSQPWPPTVPTVQPTPTFFEDLGHILGD